MGGGWRQFDWQSIARIALIFATVLFASVPAAGQPSEQPGEAPQTPTAVVAPTQAEIDSLRTAITEAVDLDATARSRALTFLDEAQAALGRLETWRARTAEIDKTIAESPGLMESLRAELASPPTESTPEVPANATLADLTQRLEEARSTLDRLQTQGQGLRGEPERRKERLIAIPNEIATVREQISRHQQSLESLGSLEGASLPVQAEALSLRASIAALSAQRRMLERERDSYEARSELLPLRIAQQQRRIAAAQQAVEFWRGRVDAKRRVEAEAAANEAKRMAEEFAALNDTTRRLSDQNQAYATRLQDLTSKSAEANRLLTRVRADLWELRESYRSVSRRVEAAGSSGAMGFLLRKELNELDDLATLRREARALTSNMADAQYDLVEIEEDLGRAGDVGIRIESLMAEAEPSINEQNREEFRRALTQLVETQLTALTDLRTRLNEYFLQLVELDTEVRTLLEANREFRDYLEERVLWIRSANAVIFPAPAELEEARQGLLSRDSLSSGANLVWEDVRSNWSEWLLILAAFVVLLVAQPWSRRRIRQIAEMVCDFRQDSFRLTARGLVYTFLAVLAVPSLLGGLALEAGTLTGNPELLIPISRALVYTATFVLCLDFVRSLLRRGGIADCHFRWPSGAVIAARRHLTWYLPIASVCVFAIYALDRQPEEAFSNSLGRAVFVVFMLLSAVLLALMFLSPRSPMSEYFRRNPTGWLTRIRYIWQALLVLLPLVLMVLALEGHYYTALRLERRLEISIALLIATGLVYHLLLRWLFIARRNLLLQQAEEKRQAEAEAGDESGSLDKAPTPIEAVNVPALNIQTRRLFRSACSLVVVITLFLVWADVLPALRMLNQIQIWPRVEVREVSTDSLRPNLDPSQEVSEAEGTTTTSETAQNGEASSSTPNDTTTPLTPMPQGSSDMGAGSAETSEAEEPLSITLADLCWSILFVIVTWILARNGPGLLEITVLKRLPLDSGARFAISTIVRYCIVLIGASLAMASVGFTWSRIQWLAAALTFGLAFGLQEIFANFVSGLIILIEQPIRVGDTVTVNNVNGTVSLIRMRATTIVDWDRKELIIPNKTFITADVINWTLSDSILRVTIPVGVAYGSDTDKAIKTLLEVARKSPLVLDDPAPQALFLGFGASSLDLELRAYIGSFENFVPLKHDLHMRIDKAFRKAKIEISFPQRDLHVRSISPDVVFQSTAKGRNSKTNDEPSEEDA